MGASTLLAMVGSRAGADLAEVSAAELDLGHRFPEDYKSLVLQSNGFEGFVADEAYLILWAVGELAQLNQAYNVSKFAPGMVLFGTDGGDTGYGFMREGDAVSYVQVPLIGMSPESVVRVGSSFDEFIDQLLPLEKG